MPPQTFERELDDRSDAAIENELRSLNANLNAATYRFLVLIREFDRRRAWGDWGMCSMVHWLGWRCGIGIVAAREHLRIAHALVALPETAALFAEGRISYSKVRALTRVATPATEGFFLNVAQHGTAAHLERIVRYARRGLALEDADRVRALVAKSFCDWHYDDDGMLVLRARLMPDDGARLVAALESMRERVFGEACLPSCSPSDQESRDAQQYHQPSALPISARRAVALAAVAEAAVAAVVASGPDDVTDISRAVPQIVVHIHSHPAGAGLTAQHDSSKSGAGTDHSPASDTSQSSVSVDAKSGSSSAEPSAGAALVAQHDSAESPVGSCRGAQHGSTALVVSPDQVAPKDSAESCAHDDWEGADSAAPPAYIEDAVAIPIATAQRLSCDASIVAMIERADGEALSIGRRRRTIPAAIRRALQSRDTCCRFPGCSHTRFVHAHHIQHWAAGGHTSLSNLVTLCSYHHKLVHEGGFTCARGTKDDLVFYTPAGHRIANAPPSPPGCDDAITLNNAHCSLDVSATDDSQWDGQRVDYDHVMFTFFASSAVTQQAAGRQ